MATRPRNRPTNADKITTRTIQLHVQVHNEGIQLMSKKQTPMESEKKPPPGTGRNTRNRGTTINIHTSDTREQRQPKSETEQHEDTPKPTETERTEDTPKPPIYDTVQRVYQSDAGREAHYATPLAATLFARFNPSDPREQPAEHYTFVDLRLKQRGYI